MLSSSCIYKIIECVAFLTSGRSLYLLNYHHNSFLLQGVYHLYFLCFCLLIIFPLSIPALRWMITDEIYFAYGIIFYITAIYCFQINHLPEIVSAHLKVRISILLFYLLMLCIDPHYMLLTRKAPSLYHVGVTQCHPVYKCLGIYFYSKQHVSKICIALDSSYTLLSFPQTFMPRLSY